MRTLRALPSLLGLLAGLAGCSLDAPPQYRVPDLRLLALRAVPGAGLPVDPDVGEALTLQALVANPRGRAVTVDWYVCAAPRPCLDEANLADPGWLARMAATPGSGVVALAADTAVTGDVASVALDLTDTAAPDDLYDRLRVAAAEAWVVAESVVPELQCTLFQELPVFAVAHADGGLEERMVKRVRFHPRAALAAAVTGDPTGAHVDAYVPNENPRIADVWTGSSDFSTCSDPTGPLGSTPVSGEVTLCGTLEPLSIGPYNVCEPPNPPRPEAEKIEWQWYVTAGEIAGTGFDGNATGRDVKLTPARGASALWLIARDGRGGTDWRRWDLAVP